MLDASSLSLVLLLHTSFTIGSRVTDLTQRESGGGSMCGAAADCTKQDGGDYSSEYTCLRYASRRGCVWLAAEACCGKKDFLEDFREGDPVENMDIEVSQTSFGDCCAAGNLDDADRDGIPDCVEAPTCTFHGMPLYEWGARPGVRDIFVEVDWMAQPPGGVDEGLYPRPEALLKVQQAFETTSRQRSNVTVAVHFDAGQLGGGNEVPYLRTLSPQGRDWFLTIDEIRKVNQLPQRRLIFYYLLFASSIQDDGGDGASGGSRISGSLVYVTLGAWDLHSRTTEDKNFLINTQAATAMHELGHALGLRHGGGDNTLNKPNYVSIMNYLYQSSGLPQLGDQMEGDRWYLENYQFGDSCERHLCPESNCAWDLLQRRLLSGPYSETFRIDYSHGLNSPIDERRVYEQRGLGSQGSAPVDFDCDGSTRDQYHSIRLVLHSCVDDKLSRWDASKPDNTEACGGKDGTRTRETVLKDYDDWGNLKLFFGEAYSQEAMALQDVESYMSHLHWYAEKHGIIF